MLAAVGATLSVAATARADDPAPVAADPAGPPQAFFPAATAAPTAAVAPTESCSINPCKSDCACMKRCCSKCGCDGSPKVSLSVTGVRASVTHVNTGVVNDSTIGVGFAGAADAYALNGTTHGASYFMLGGGEGGFEGALAGTIDIGYRIPVSEAHGPFGRIGFDGRLQGNDLLYFSLLELPRLTLGWQYLSGKTVLEAGARGGAVLTGLYDPASDGRRALNGFEWGGFVSGQADFIKLDATFMRILAKKTLNGTPVDIGRAELCVVGKGVGLCIDGMLFRGDAELRASAPGTIHSTSSQYVGLTLGFAGF
jgi:hypothetical protein